MNKPEENDPIEKLLREQDAYIPDDGFTRRVMSNLPRRHSSWLARVVMLGAAAAGIVMAWYWLPSFTMPEMEFLLSNPQTLFACLPLLAVAAALYHAVARGLQAED